MTRGYSSARRFADEQRRIEAVLAKGQLARADRRAAAALRWGDGDERTRQRTAMLIAAFLLDQDHEFDLADWLLLAKPEHARIVAAGVAVHGLRRGRGLAWDALMAADAMDMDQAVEWFEADRDFVWSPDPDQLYADAV